MASGVETEKGLAAALDAALVQAVLATRSLKADPDDLFLRTGSGRAKKHTSPHHIAYAATAMVTGNPKDAVANAKGFGALAAGKIDGVIRDVTSRKEDGTPGSESIFMIDMREKGTPQKPNTLLMGYDMVPVDLSSEFNEKYPVGQSFIDAYSDLLRTLATQARNQELTANLFSDNPPPTETEIWFTTHPFRHATIVYKISSRVTIKRNFASVQSELAAQSAAQSAGFSTYGRVSYEIIGWPALVAMARLVHLDEGQEDLPNSNPPPAEGGVGDVETSAARKKEAVEAPPSTVSYSLKPLANRLPNQQQAFQHSKHPTYNLSLSPGEGVGMLGVSAGLQEVTHLANESSQFHAKSYSYPVGSAVLGAD